MPNLYLTFPNRFLTHCLTPLPYRFGKANEVFQNSKVHVCVTETEFIIFLNVFFMQDLCPDSYACFVEGVIHYSGIKFCSPDILSAPTQMKRIQIAERVPPKVDLNISALSQYEVLNMRKEKALPMSKLSSGQHYNYAGLLKSIFLCSLKA